MGRFRSTGAVPPIRKGVLAFALFVGLTAGIAAPSIAQPNPEQISPAPTVSPTPTVSPSPCVCPTPTPAPSDSPKQVSWAFLAAITLLAAVIGLLVGRAIGAWRCRGTKPEGFWKYDIYWDYEWDEEKHRWQIIQVRSRGPEDKLRPSPSPGRSPDDGRTRLGIIAGLVVAILAVSGVAMAQVYTPTPPPAPRPTPTVGVTETEAPVPTEAPSPSPTPVATRIVTQPSPTPCVCPTPTPVTPAEDGVAWAVVLSAILLAFAAGFAAGYASAMAGCKHDIEIRDQPPPEPIVDPEQFGATGGGESTASAAPGIVN